MPDHYAVLGVGRDASQDEIKRAYRKMARQHHPDANADPQAEDRFKELNAAYEVLSDPERRRRYDQFGDDRSASSPFAGFGDLGDLMETFFGGSPFGSGRQGPHRGPQQGDDLAVAVEITLGEAATGAQRTVTLNDLVTCEPCGGNGCEPGTFRLRCSRCAGTGEMRSVQRSIFGQVMTSRPCTACGGAGDGPASPCRSCGGVGTVTGTRTVEVQVPAGVAAGMTLRVGGRGRPGSLGGPPGDLFVRVSVVAHEVFEREGDDLRCVVGVPFSIATLGGDVHVPTLDGEETLHVEPGTPSGQEIRLRDRGIPHLQARGAGDLVVRLDVVVPRDLSAEQRAAVEALARLRDETVDPPAAGFVSKIKDALRKER